MLNPPVKGKIQGLFKAFECFSCTFQGKFNLQGLLKTVLYIQVLSKPVRTLIMEQDNLISEIQDFNEGILIVGHLNISCPDPESFDRGSPTLTFFLFDEGRGSKDPNTIKGGPSSARQQNDGPTLNAGLVIQ